MKKLKSFSNVWNVEKVFYAINDIKLPFALTYTQIAWFVGAFFFVLIFRDIPPLLFIKNGILVHIGIPIGISWFMSQKMLDGKRPHRYLMTMIAFLFRSKVTFMEKPVKKRREKSADFITVVRSIVKEVDCKDIYHKNAN